MPALARTRPCLASAGMKSKPSCGRLTRNWLQLCSLHRRAIATAPLKAMAPSLASVAEAKGIKAALRRAAGKLSQVLRSPFRKKEA